MQQQVRERGGGTILCQEIIFHLKLVITALALFMFGLNCFQVHAQV